MPRKKKKAARTGAPRAKSQKTVEPSSVTEQAPPPVPTTATDLAAATQRFTRDLQIRGEAAKLDKKGKLPRHATHVIKKQHPDGSVEVERVRFKTF
ncbi:MAG TPA: hypothetical protein VI431_05385 [Candidatus Acidoferrum sp.]